MARGTTPAQIAVEKGCGYFCGNDFKVKFELDGHEVHELNVLTTPSGWYVAGNIVFGFIVGWFIVDPLTGSMFTLEPNIASADLRPKSRQSGAEAPTLRLTTLDNVPEAALPFLKKVD
ncbi:MAG: hypothetical protein FJX46_12960 [Alphaproteobacteria bacterium]|nr:hypothetical protein [Alphaproteobacteria bacterium]